MIILDDAFQHRYVKAGLDILLTDYNNLFTRDWFLPTGDLRDMKSSYKRAAIIVVTKCKPYLSVEEKESISKEIGILPHQHIFFTSIEYGEPYHIISKELKQVSENMEVLLVTGIANPKPLKSIYRITPVLIMRCHSAITMYSVLMIGKISAKDSMA